MTTGSFTGRAGQRHVLLRDRMLSSGAGLAPLLHGAAACPPRPEQVGRTVAPLLREHGAAAVPLEEPLTDADLLAFGASLGTITPETDPAVQPMVTGGLILNLLRKHQRTDDVSLQPFAENSLSLHSEGSGRRAADQPRYIVLMCCEPGDNPASARTVLVPMAAVTARLTPREREVLSRTRYAHLPPGEPVLRPGEDAPVSSFRDFLTDTLDWVNDGGDDPAEVNAALESLLTAMYAPGARGVRWSAGLLVVIDNTRHFHGRTAGETSTSRPRHLKRLRIR